MIMIDILCLSGGTQIFLDIDSSDISLTNA